MKNKFKQITLILLFVMLQIQMSASCNQHENHNQSKSPIKEKYLIFKPVIDTLLKKGVDSAYIYKLLDCNETNFDEKYIKINVTGYLKKTDYSHNYNTRAVQKSKDFLRENIEILKKVEKEYGVNKETIVAILWVETKLGTYLGKNHIPSVFFSTALVNLPQYIQVNIKELDSLNLDTAKYNQLVEKIHARSRRKSDWAINELVAMSKIDKKNMLQFHSVYGSWAGAFGMSQFLPSSYYKHAVDGNNDGKIDLFDKEDAIFSIANYLKNHGWMQNDVYMQRKSVFAYNNSNDYVNAVFKLANKLK